MDQEKFNPDKEDDQIKLQAMIELGLDKTKIMAALNITKEDQIIMALYNRGEKTNEVIRQPKQGSKNTARFTGHGIRLEKSILEYFGLKQNIYYKIKRSENGGIVLEPFKLGIEQAVLDEKIRELKNGKKAETNPQNIDQPETPQGGLTSCRYTGYCRRSTGYCRRNRDESESTR